MKRFALLAALAAIALIAWGLSDWRQSTDQKKRISAQLAALPQSDGMPGELEKRLRSADQSAREGSETIPSLVTLSQLYHANGYTREAWSCYTILMQLESRSARWPHLLATLAASFGDLQQATPLFEKAAALAPDNLATRIHLGNTHLKQNQLSAAAAAFTEALRIAPEDPHAELGLARVALAQEDLDTAKTHLENATRYSRFAVGADLLAQLYEQVGLPSKRDIVLQNKSWGSHSAPIDPWHLEVMRESFDPYQLSIAGGTLMHQGQDETALPFLERAVRLAPENADYHYQLGNLYFRLDREKDALQHYETCTDLRPHFADAWLNRIEIAKNNRQAAQVKKLLRQALRAAPQSPSLAIEQGKALLASNRPTAALAAFRRSIELRPYEAVGYIELANAYISLGRIEEGIEQMRRALAQEPDHPMALSTLAFDAITKRDRSAADAWLERIEGQARIGTAERERLRRMYHKAFASNDDLVQ